jgi:hypothetical protein
MQPVSLTELGSFLQMIVYAYQDYLFLAFVLMISFTVLLNVKRLFLDGML